jgi:hypothetical protein
MAQFMPSAKSPPLRPRVGVYIDNGAISKADYLCFTVCQPPILDLYAHAVSDDIQVDVRRIGDTEF